MFSQKQCCKPTQNAPDTGKEKYYSPILKIKSLIRYPENGAGSALLLLRGHPGCHCFGDEDTDVAQYGYGSAGPQGCSLPGGSVPRQLLGE